MKHWIGLIVGLLLVGLGSFTAHKVQTSGGVTVNDVRFETADQKTLSALLYVPIAATAAKPAPGILAVHGYINSREAQSGFAIEFARRGYVVLALDQMGHGYSDAPAFGNGFGGPAGLAYLRSLPMVDTSNIGLEGHSMGGWTVLAAAAAMPDAYRSMVLEGSTTGPPFAADGSPVWPRNLSVVFSEYDEFSQLMWGTARAKDVSASPKLMALFHTGSPVQVNTLYGDIGAGTARILQQPPVTHPGDHLSHEAIGHAIDWFALTLDGGVEIGTDDQIWIRKELATLMALVGLVVVLLGMFRGLLSLPLFAGVSQPAVARMSEQSSAVAVSAGASRGWLRVVLSAAIPALVFYPLFSWAETALPPSAWLPQGITNQVLVWALGTTALLFVVSLGLGTGREEAVVETRPGVSTIFKGCLAAGLALVFGYLLALLVARYLLVDFRFWFVGLKVMSAAQWQMAGVYFWPFLLYFALSLQGAHRLLAQLNVSRGGSGHPEAAGYFSTALLLAGGLLLMLLVQYGWLFATGALLTASEPLNTIVMIQFVPLLSIVAVISTYMFRATRSTLPGALACAMLVTWYVVAGQATQFG